MALFPPAQTRAFLKAVLDEILQERVVSSRHRRNFRGVKRKMSNFPLRPRHVKPLLKINIRKAIRIVKWTVLTLADVFATGKELGYSAKHCSNLFDRIVRRRSPDLRYRLQHIPSKHNQPVHNQAHLLSGKEQEWSASTACRAQLFRNLCLRLRNSQYERTNRIGCEPNVIMLICLIH